MPQVHLVLSGPAFGEHAGRGHVLDLAGAADFGEYRGELFDAGHRVDLLAGTARRFSRRRGRADAAVSGSAWIDHIELHFQGHHGPQSELREPLGDLLEHMARVAEERRAIVVSHADLDLCNLLVHPGSADEGILHRRTGAIGIPIVETEARGLDRVAECIHCEDRTRQAERAGIHSGKRVYLQPFAAGR
jgi:hypothetical protein